ncbi:uncharacterized protein SEPMUDRAFT_149648 [Sphaerulina musiva SO2202]|uniref:Uncharacterized protein n=1 Tax=Sphaerulina musiva (strain SO2202) TaxID=692275 RepID=N1QF18_SPHMS|nr:uncharacterized protein SEPMUDRAFT_149648 [Sphaerulina musiva SO2202]EMF11752.1 hypothetical protein SEPMUDRAFT_149648 [Sphaerulina musiva SO2202]
MVMMMMLNNPTDRPTDRPTLTQISEKKKHSKSAKLPTTKGLSLRQAGTDIYARVSRSPGLVQPCHHQGEA